MFFFPCGRTVYIPPTRLAVFAVFTLGLAAGPIGCGSPQPPEGAGGSFRTSARSVAPAEPAPRDEPPPELPRVEFPADPLPKGAIARMGTTRHRTLSVYPASSLSPDAKTLAFRAERGEIGFLDTTTGLITKRLSFPRRGFPRRGDGGGEDIDGLLYAPDGKRVALVGFRDVKVIEVATGQVVAALNEEADLFSFNNNQDCLLSFSADGNRLAVGRGSRPNRSVMVWDVAENRALATIKPLQNHQASVALSADGNTLATWGRHLDPANPAGGKPNGIIQLWDMDTQKERMQIYPEGHGPYTSRGGVSRVSLSADGKRLATLAAHDLIELYDTTSGKRVGTFPCRPWVAHLSLSPDAKQIVALSRKNDTAALQVWDTASGKLLTDQTRPTGQTDDVVFTRPDRAVIWSVAGGVLTMWELQSGKRMTPFLGHSSAVQSVAFSPSGRTVVSSASDREVIEWNPATSSALTTTFPVSDVTRLDLRQLAVSRRDDSVSRWHARRGVRRRIAGLPGPTVYERSVESPSSRCYRAASSICVGRAVYSRDGKRLVVIASNLKLAHDDRPKLRVWDVESGRCLAELPINLNGAEALTADFSPSGNRLVAVAFGRSDNRTSELHWFLRVTGWDLTTGKQLGEFTHACSFTDSLSVAAGDESGAVLAFRGQIWGAGFRAGAVGLRDRPHRTAAAGDSPQGILSAGIQLGWDANGGRGGRGRAGRFWRAHLRLAARQGAPHLRWPHWPGYGACIFT